MRYAHTIAIDGSAGCGKTSLGHRLAQRLDYFFLDTGILYRGIARYAMNIGVHVHEPQEVIAYAETLTITVTQLQPRFSFELNGRSVRKLNTLQLDRITPILAAYPEIRDCVRRVQREIAAQGRVILAGRDIGTVVLPDAELKIYLDVSLEERAKRRFLYKNREGRTLEQIEQDLLLRDLADTTREESPMAVAEDAIIINTDSIEVDDVVEMVLQHARMECDEESLPSEVEN